MQKNIAKMLKQAQKMQSEMMKAQDSLMKQEFEGTAGGGMVKVILNGASELQKIAINPEVVDPQDVEMLEDMIVAAFANAQEKVKTTTSSAMGSLTGGMQIPGLM